MPVPQTAITSTLLGDRMHKKDTSRRDLRRSVSLGFLYWSTIILIFQPQILIRKNILANQAAHSDVHES